MFENGKYVSKYEKEKESELPLGTHVGLFDQCQEKPDKQVYSKRECTELPHLVGTLDCVHIM
jgi:hypothetical protein